MANEGAGLRRRGDLSYNYVESQRTRTARSAQQAKSTRVYVKQGGQWMLVHANFGDAN
jgi:hypothetical protein